MVKKMRVKIYDVLCIKNIFDTVFRYDCGASGAAPVPVTQNSSASSAPAILVVCLATVGKLCRNLVNLQLTENQPAISF
jgi:hypothetical protein